MPASDKKLGDLHEAVTDALINMVKGIEIDQFDDEGQPTGEKTTLPPSAAVIQAAAKFLKDNEITCTPSEDNKLGELKKAATERAEKRRARSIDLEQAREDGSFLSGLN